MKKALETIDVIRDIENIVHDLPGVKITIYSEEDYTMLKINNNDDREIVILDLRSAVGKGMIIMNNLKMSLKSPYIVVISNINTDDFRERCRKLGADYFFDKKREMHEFGKFLTKHLHIHKNSKAFDASIV